MPKKLTYLTIITSALILVGCTQKDSSTEVEMPLPMQGSTTETESSPKTQAPAKSSGDIDQDIEAIENELDSLDTKTDFPDYSASDFE